MEEFEILEGVAEMFEAAEVEGAGIAAEAAEVEENVAVQEMAEVPAITEQSSQSVIRNFINNNPYGQRLWTFSKWAAKETVSASVIFGVTYGLNRAIAKSSHESGKRTALSDYLKSVEKNFTENLHLSWTQETKQRAAEDALSFPWIDSSQ